MRTRAGDVFDASVLVSGGYAGEAGVMMKLEEGYRLERAAGSRVKVTLLYQRPPGGLSDEDDLPQLCIAASFS